MGLLRKQNFKCALTGWDLEIRTTELDHIVPRCDGGLNTIDNLQFVHKDANRMKGQLPMKRLLEVCRAIVLKADGSFESNFS